MAINSSTTIHAQEPEAEALRLATSAHQRAAAIDSLDRFFFRAFCGTRFDLELPEPSDDAIDNFKAAFDADVGPDGKVVGHGSLDDEDADLLATLRRLDR